MAKKDAIMASSPKRMVVKIIDAYAIPVITAGSADDSPNGEPIASRRIVKATAAIQGLRKSARIRKKTKKHAEAIR